MSSDARKLYRAIWENPDDDTPRLVFADKLDEMGGEKHAARARLIRLQILGGDDPPADDAECAAIVAFWHERWYPRRSGPLEAGKTTYRRGFVAEYAVDLPSFRGDGDTLLGMLESVVQFFPTLTAFRCEGIATIPAREGYDINGKPVYLANTYRLFPGQPIAWVEGTEDFRKCFVHRELIDAIHGREGATVLDVSGATVEEALARFGQMLAAHCRREMGLPEAHTL